MKNMKKKASTKELKRLWKRAESKIEEYDKFILEIRSELRGRRK